MNDSTKEEKDDDDEDEDDEGEEEELLEERTLDKMGNYRSTRIESISAAFDFPSTTNSCPW